jgi:hypothetical protein
VIVGVSVADVMSDQVVAVREKARFSGHDATPGLPHA